MNGLGSQKITLGGEGERADANCRMVRLSGDGISV